MENLYFLRSNKVFEKEEKSICFSGSIQALNGICKERKKFILSKWWNEVEV